METRRMLYALFVVGIALAALFVQGEQARAQNAGLFPFIVNPWEVSPDNITNVSHWLERPAGRAGFVWAEGGGFVTGDGKPIRFLGVNLSYGANFPTHKEAEQLADRLARFGINLVRFHHTERYDAPSGLFKAGVYPREIDPEMLDRLDYFVAQLKERGIYSNFNLKTARTLQPEEGFPFPDERPTYDKGLDLFYRDMIEEHKRIYRELLTHVNPYTGNAYVDEPALAQIEITNENGLFYVWQRGQLDAAPAYYLEALDTLWVEWLKEKYGTTESLRKAWGGAGALVSDGVELVANGDFTSGILGWQIQNDSESEATPQWAVGGGPALEDGTVLNALQLTVTRKGRDSWIPQILRAGVNMEPGHTYRISFWARVEGPAREVRANTMLAIAPYTSYWGETVEVGPEWRRYEFDFRVPADSPRGTGRITFTRLEPGNVYWFAGVSVQRVTEHFGLGLPNGESLETGVSRPTWSDIVRRTDVVQNDYAAFLYDVEKAYFEEMYRFLKEELGVKSLVTGSQVPLTPLSIQANLDYIDTHLYYKHPQFPTGGWDENNWYVENTSMVNGDGGTIPTLSGLRIAGKPFVVSEYNHAAPNTYSSEGFLLAGAYGAFQDWSGIVIFDWSLNRDYDAVQITNYFNIKGHSTKLVTLPAVHALFLRGDVSVGEEVVHVPAPDELPIYLERSQTSTNLAAWSREVPRSLSLQTRVARVLPGVEPSEEGEPLTQPAIGPVLTSETGELTWDRTNPQRSLVTIDTALSKAAIGYGAGKVIDFSGAVRLEPGPTRQDGWSAITLTVMDGEGFAGPARMLLTATGYVQNTNMVIEQLSGDRITVRTRWGTGPVLVEGIPARFTLPVSADRVRVYALDMIGNRGRELPVTGDGSSASFEIGPAYRTLWYEVVID